MSAPPPILRVASVLLPMPLPEAFDYAEPEGMRLAVGDQVVAPLGPRQVRGVVTALREAHGVNRPLKPLLGKLDDAPLPLTTVAFVEWAARYACEPAGEALAMALRGVNHAPPRPEKRLVATGAAPTRMTPARQRVMESMAPPEGLRAPDLARAARVSSGVIKALVEEGVLAPPSRFPRRRPTASPIPPCPAHG